LAVSGLRGSDIPLVEAYDVALLDLDGVVYLQEEAVPEAATALAATRQAGMRLEFVTNNASRRADAVVALLGKVGVAARPEEVVTSAQASAALLAERLPAGSAVLVVGADALGEELVDVGLRPVRSADDQPAALVQGYGPGVGWEQLAEASVALRAGALWVATNTDATFPSPRGPLPGNGSMVAALMTATDRVPDEIVGKPHPRLHQESVRRSGAQRPLVVGDRLDTDIEGAVLGECDSLLVLTGVTTPAGLIAAPPGARPTYVSADLHGLLVGHPAPESLAGNAFRCGGWTVTVDSGGLRLAGEGESIDALRALCAAAWQHELAAPSLTADGEPALRALSELELPATP
jgi:HAD superfamily hydrolase (TIGR01450 family)